MQASSISQRPQRRSPISDQGTSSMPPPPAPPSGQPSQHASVSSARSSSGSGRSSKRKDPQTQLSQIEKSVTHLLIATKQLLETLTQWSRHTATEGEVSDVYVRLGYEFNIACRAFSSIGVPTDDLGPVPDLLRGILEETLSQEASPQSLDKFLPRIRDIIINLLHGLKKKQSKLRATRVKESGPQPNGQPVRQASLVSGGGDDNAVAQQSDETAAAYNRASYRASQRLNESEDGGDPAGPKRASSTYGGLQDDRPLNRESGTQKWEARASRQGPPSVSDSSMSSNTAQNIPVISPEESSANPIRRISLSDDVPPPPPPPPPKQQDAMALLQRGGELERRASRRYSAYQISKHLGASPGGVPMLPPAQNTPIPNRGRDVRESLNAVRTRGSYMSRQKSSRFNDASPSRGTPVSGKIAEEQLPRPDRSAAAYKGPTESTQDDSISSSKTPDDKLASSWKNDDGNERVTMSGTVSGPFADSLSDFPTPTSVLTREPQKSRDRPTGATSSAKQRAEETVNGEFIPEDSPQPGTELTLFLQFKSKIKKFVLPDGANDLSLARLQLAFIEKFAWNTHNNGVDLPEIYLQDPVSGVRHELEDLADVKDRSVLVLNIEPLDEVKKHFDDGLGGLRKIVEGVRLAVDGQQATIARVSERQQEAASEIARISSVPASTVQVNGVKTPIPASDESMHEIQTLRRDLAVMRQSFSTFTSGVKNSMEAIRVKADTVKAKSIDVAIPVLEGDTGRSYVNAGKKTVGDDSDTLVGRVDDLQDLVEDLRKDVVSRGVRPLPRQLEAINKDISDSTKELKKMQEYVKREKPTWTKIWEKELELVCNDREFLTMQEELICDLEDDLEKATQTMALVEEATKQQALESTTAGQASLRNASRTLPNIDPDVDPATAKSGVLGEVRALQPNHESRIEAIERAEKARQRELQDRHENAAFRKELSTFVDEGKLKKSGGIDEIERQRRLKDETAIKQEHSDILVVKAERAKQRAEEKARKAAEEAEAQQNGDDFDGHEDGPFDQGNDHEAEPNGHDAEDPNGNFGEK